VNIIGFIIASLNNTATYLFWAAFVAFLVLCTHGIVFYRYAFWVMVISLAVCFLTPNKEETERFFSAAAEQVESPVSSPNSGSPK